jgi:hypothetical protein
MLTCSALSGCTKLARRSGLGVATHSMLFGCVLLFEVNFDRVADKEVFV